MTLQELKLRIEEGSVDRTEKSEDERAYFALYNLFSIVSKTEIQKFQIGFNPKSGYEVFYKDQDRLYLELIGIETSDLGKTVREVYKLPPLTLETELT